MSKDLIPLHIVDISSFARHLNGQLRSQSETPSHLSLMNMLARAAGFRNFQHLRAAQTAQTRLDAPQDATLDFKLVERTLNQFDDIGRLRQWPAKRTVQELCIWVFWSLLPAQTTLQERDVNGHLNQAHLFDDAAILRRSLVGMGLVERNLDGTDYRRIEQAPPPEAREVIRRVQGRRQG